jgi:Arc/MetJ-type ribon-helix-helix transcriptional regulator
MPVVNVTVTNEKSAWLDGQVASGQYTTQLTMLAI